MPVIQISVFFSGLSGNKLETCRMNPEEYSSRMKGCFDQFQKSISDNKDVIGIVTITIIAFLVNLHMQVLDVYFHTENK